MLATTSRVFVAGHRGMVGSALVRALQAKGITNLILPSRQECDLTNRDSVDRLYQESKPEVVIVAAAKVGGILANSRYPADFLLENLLIAEHCITAAHEHGTQRLLFLGSSCIYPRMAPQPIEESSLLTSPLESTNEAYAIAKIAGLKLCQAFRRQHGKLFHSAMPTNLYGPADNYHPENSHVIPGLLRRFHEAKVNGTPSVSCWGTGSPRREFLHVDDLAEGCLHLLGLENPPDWVNIGTGTDVTIAELVALVAETVGYQGEVLWDSTKPDGTPRKLLNIDVIKGLGWTPQIALREGLQQTYASFLKELAAGTLRG